MVGQQCLFKGLSGFETPCLNTFFGVNSGSSPVQDSYFLERELLLHYRATAHSFILEPRNALFHL